jgi:hypothetical protein
MFTKNLSLATAAVILVLGCASIPTNAPKTSQAEASSTPIASASKETNTKANTKLRSGSFISGEHTTNDFREWSRPICGFASIAKYSERVQAT